MSKEVQVFKRAIDDYLGGREAFQKVDDYYYNKQAINNDLNSKEIEIREKNLERIEALAGGHDERSARLVELEKDLDQLHIAKEVFLRESTDHHIKKPIVKEKKDKRINSARRI